MRPLIERMLYITLALVFVAAGTFAYLAIQATDRFSKQQEVLQQQVAGQKEVLRGVQELLANQGQTTDSINRSLSCILTFFTVPFRTNYFISDLPTCTITNIQTGESEVLPLPSPPAPASGVSEDGDPQQRPPSVSPAPSPPPPSTPPPDDRTVVEHLLDNTTDFTCGLIRLLCSQE